MNRPNVLQNFLEGSGVVKSSGNSAFIRLRNLTVLVLLIQLALVSKAMSGDTNDVVRWHGHVPDFGPNVTIFDPSMPTNEIRARADELFAQQRDSEMGSARYSLLFMPGEYGTAEEPLQIAVGYYTEVAGLGMSPSDVQINGKVEVFNRCFDIAENPVQEGDASVNRCFALNNFWRSISNLTIRVNGLGQGGCEASANFWAVSQAASMRRVQVIGGNLSLMDYCGPGPQFASGGFIADTRVIEGDLINGSQQQWITRNSEVANWTNPVWNQVFTGVVGAPDDSGYAVCVNAPLGCAPYTTIDTTPVSREKPYLFVDEYGDFYVRVPKAQFESRGITWADGSAVGRNIPLRKFFVATPSDPARKINRALSRGKHVLFTPGVYDIAKTIKVKRANTVVLGLGHATLHAINGAVPMKTQDKPGIIIAGMTLDAGEQESPMLLQVGKKRRNNSRRNSNPRNPVTLSDVYFRIGGPYVGKTDIALQINSNHVLIDHTWVWRADHGVEGFEANCDPLDPANCVDGFLGDDIRWTTNIGRNGVVVNGNDVTATGLFVEHFQEYNTIWNGERGRVYLYQNELPYDPPTQADWIADDGTLGWAAYKVADHVRKHQLWGAGSYIFNRNNPSIETENAFEVPETAGVQLNRILINNLSGPGIMNNIVNGCGPTVDGIPDAEFGDVLLPDPGAYENPRYLLRYPDCPDGF